MTYTLPSPRVHNHFYSLVGRLFILLNKIRHEVRGYQTPRSFSTTDHTKVWSYDQDVVKGWERALHEYTKNFMLSGKHILEIGPGADLGIGLLLLSRGVQSYHAIDINPLALEMHHDLYEYIFAELARDPLSQVSVDTLRQYLDSSRETTEIDKKLDYRVDPQFDLRVFKNSNIDLVVSQAAFEHISEFEKTATMLEDTVVPGGVLVAEIDFQTHTRFLRDRDPLNIYRYSDTFYNRFAFRESPNRLRPHEYTAALEKHGFTNIVFVPLRILDTSYMHAVQRTLAPRFQDDTNRMEVLSGVILATKK